MRSREKGDIIKPRTRMPLQRLAPLTWPRSPYSDIPCSECVRSGCSDCCARTAGAAVMEGLGEPSLPGTRCVNMTVFQHRYNRC